MGGLRSTPCEESCHRFSIVTIKKTIDTTNANYYRKNSYSQDASTAMLSRAFIVIIGFMRYV